MMLLLIIPLYLIVTVMVIYTIRHYHFTLNRLFVRYLWGSDICLNAKLPLHPVDHNLKLQLADA